MMQVQYLTPTPSLSSETAKSQVTDLTGPVRRRAFSVLRSETQSARKKHAACHSSSGLCLAVTELSDFANLTHFDVFANILCKSFRYLDTL